MLQARTNTWLVVYQQYAHSDNNHSYNVDTFGAIKYTFVIIPSDLAPVICLQLNVLEATFWNTHRAIVLVLYTSIAVTAPNMQSVCLSVCLSVSVHMSVILLQFLYVCLFFNPSFQVIALTHARTHSPTHSLPHSLI